MPTCQNHPRKKNAKLCMGCGKYFCDDCGKAVHGVFYCTGCSDMADEFAATKKLANEDDDFRDAEKEKWEAGFSSASMVVLTRHNLDKISEPLPLNEIYAGLMRRAFGYLIDWIVAVPKFWYIVQYYKLGSEHDVKFLLAAEIGWAFFYFIIFNFTTGMTMGKLIAATRLVDSYGRQVSFAQAFGRSFISFITLPVMPAMALLHGLCYMVTSGKKGFHDLVMGTYVVMDEPWRKMAKDAIANGGVLRRKNKAPKEVQEFFKEPEEQQAEEDKPTKDDFAQFGF